MIAVLLIAGCGGGPPASRIELAIYQACSNRIKYKVTNKYTRKVDDEKWWIYEFDGEYRGKVALVKRGSEWQTP
jgi:hypothetical protein